MPRIALVAKTCPLLPSVSTTIEATTTMRSAIKEKRRKEKNGVVQKTSKRKIQVEYFNLLPFH